FERFIDSNKTSQVFNLNDEDKSDLKKLTSSIGDDFYHYLILFRVKVSNERKGFFAVASKAPKNDFKTGNIQNAESMIQKANNILVESRLVKDAQKTIKQLDRVFELSKDLTLETEIQELLRKIAVSIRRTLGWNIVILDKKNYFDDTFETVCLLGMQSEQQNKFKEEYPEGIYPALKDKSFKISNAFFYDLKLSGDKQKLAQNRHRFLLSLGKKWQESDWIMVPIRSHGKELGYIAVNDPVDQVRPSEEKVRSLEYFANQAAVALENAALYEDLKASENKYRLLAETMIMGLVTCDYDGNILYANDSLVKMLGYSLPSSLEGQNLIELCHDKQKTELEESLLNTKKQIKNATDLEEESVEIELLTNDNNFIPFKIYLTPLQNQLKDTGFLGVLADMRPQRRLERLKADFNSMVVHDLRSPLNIIQGYVDIVRNQVVGQITEEQDELLFIVKENVDKVLKLIDNFMTASKLEAGKFDIELETHALNSIVEAVFQQHLMIAQKKNIEMAINLDQNIGFQQFDRMRIEQVLSNYISNAIKFTDEHGKITIESKLVKEPNELTGQESCYTWVSVSDTGVGIPYDEQDKVFSKYEQTEAGKDASLKGTGLGLAICKEIITLHKGKVWVESEPAKGSTFYFSLPVKSPKS
ncbi:MAG: PAS domain S-box protein, partial [Caldithrix sp.]|nr:PAS domain S-box protein [Caldithrix sp.]